MYKKTCAVKVIFVATYFLNRTLSKYKFRNSDCGLYYKNSIMPTKLEYSTGSAKFLLLPNLLY